MLTAFLLTVCAAFAQDIIVSESDVERVVGRPAFASAACWIGDWNGDGKRDIAVSEPSHAFEPEFRGRVEVLCGVTGEEIASLEAEAHATRFGYALARAPDVDGDGVDDVIVSARVAVEGESTTFDVLELTLLGSRGGRVRVVRFPAPGVGLLAVGRLPGTRAGSPESVGALLSVSSEGTPSRVTYSALFAKGGPEAVWTREASAVAARLVAADDRGGACCVLVERHGEGNRIVVLDVETGEESSRLVPAGRGAFSGSVAYLAAGKDGVPRIAAVEVGGCDVRHYPRPAHISVFSPAAKPPIHDAIQVFRADDGAPLARMCAFEFEQRVDPVTRRGLDPHHLGSDLAALARHENGERVDDALVVVDALYEWGVAVIMEPADLRPLVSAPPPFPFPRHGDDAGGRAWSLDVEPADGASPPRLLLGTLSPYGWTHSGVLICSSADGSLLSRIVRPAPSRLRSGAAD